MASLQSIPNHIGFESLRRLGIHGGEDPYFLNTNHTYSFQLEQSRWLQSQLASLRGLRDLFTSKRQWFYAKGWPLSAANNSLRNVVQGLRNTGIYPCSAGYINFGISFDADDDEIKQFCESKARQCERVIFSSSNPAKDILAILDGCGINPAGLKHCSDLIEFNWRARASCDRWWIRSMRRVCQRRAEQVCRESGFVSRRSGVYVSDFTLQRWRSAQRRNQSILESLEAINCSGEAYNLAELAALGQSNMENRRNELMVRMRGFEECATADGFAAKFYTVTCPSSFHLYSGDRKNPNYSGATPTEAAAYLQGMWSRCRAELARGGVQYYGFRIAEPHHDGCPHWHLLLFVAPSDQHILDATMRRHALRVEPDEPGADQHRFTVVNITAAAGTAAGYVAKYVAKNIDGYEVGEDYEAGQSAGVTAARVLAWASTWGIRQFQQIGGPSVTVYRELRRAANAPERLPPELPVDLLDAADDGDWCKFVAQMGGPVLPRIDRPCKPLYQAFNRRTYEKVFGKYGEPLKFLVGVIGDAFLLVSRWREWVIRRAAHATF